MAASQSGLWLGLALVLLAGLFREYDQEDLLGKPWFLLLPLAASLGAIAALFAVIRTLPGVRGCRLPVRDQFRRFVSCFWMTAPPAAIYALPVERFASPAVAAETNLWFLAAVSCWRVLLMTQVIRVLYGDTFWRSLFCVMLVGDAAVLFFTVIIPIPLLEIMGGIGLTDQERIINSARMLVFLPGLFLLPIWLIGTITNCFQPPRSAETPAYPEDVPVSRSVRWGVAAGFAVMLAACFATQPEQRRGGEFERLALAGRHAEAIAYLQRFSPDDLPPHWEPVPHIGHRQATPDPYAVLDAALDAEEVRPWIVDLYARKVRQLRGTGFYSRFFWDRLSDAQLETVVRLLERFPDYREELDVFDDYWDTSIRRWLQVRLDVGNRYAPERKRPPQELLLRLVEVSGDCSNCPTQEQVRERILKGLPPE